MYLFELIKEFQHFAATEPLNKGEKKVAAKYSEIYKGIDINSNEEIIIKKLKFTGNSIDEDIERFKNEAQFEFIHTGLIKKSYFIEHDKEIFIVRPYIKGIDFKSILYNPKLSKNFTTPDFVCKCMVKVLEAIQHLHQNNIIHRDIKPSNIIVEYNGNDEIDIENPNIKLIDYAFAFKYNEGSFPRSNNFALIYSPPELVLGLNELIDFSSDLYSLAISMYEIISHTTPFQSENPLKSISLQITSNLEYNKKIPKSLFSIISKATTKYNFPRPPSFYDYDELKNIFEEIKLKRYINAADFIDDIKKLKE